MLHSAGIICYKYDGELLIFLAHSTGHKDIWSFPKGEGEFPETLLECALREFKEETSVDIDSFTYDMEEFMYLGSIQQSKIKIVHAFAVKFDIDPKECKSNWCEFPIGTGKMIPELDDYKWVTYDEAMRIINPKQIPLLIALKLKV
jgi:predicted NUDIX family NTP pyrophosphohydrolase